MPAKRKAVAQGTGTTRGNRLRNASWLNSFLDIPPKALNLSIDCQVQPEILTHVDGLHTLSELLAQRVLLLSWLCWRLCCFSRMDELSRDGRPSSYPMVRPRNEEDLVIS